MDDGLETDPFVGSSIVFQTRDGCVDANSGRFLGAMESLSRGSGMGERLFPTDVDADGISMDDIETGLGDRRTIESGDDLFLDSSETPVAIGGGFACRTGVMGDADHEDIKHIHLE